MTELTYAFIKNGEVINLAVFDTPNDELLTRFQVEYELDQVVLTTDNAVVGGTYDGSKFWLPKPYPSWVKGINNWESPIPMPTDGANYAWNEETISWDKIPVITE
jgi:hypothetical protein